MRFNRSTLLIALLVLVAAVSTSCASSQVVAGASDRDAVTQARISFDAASIDYEAGLKSITGLRAAGLVTDGQWSIAVTARNTVAEWAPSVRAALNLWKATGTKPESYAAALAKVNAAFADIRTITNAVKNAGGTR